MKRDDPRKADADAAKNFFNPFGSTLIEKTHVVVPTRTDLWDFLSPLCTDNRYKAGGYSIFSFYEHAITDAYAGLGVFVSEEMARKSKKADTDVAIDVS
jgi:hypothetical protein